MSERPEPDNAFSGFTSMRAFLWPIHTYELKKFLPTAFMLFLVVFNYTIMRNTKDTLVVPMAGPEVIPILKGAIILPISICLVALYNYLANFVSLERLFYGGVSMFMVAFTLFYFVLFPYRADLLPDPVLIEGLKETYPRFQHFFSVYQNWVYVFFYLFAELWGAITLQFLFWSFANDVTRIEESKRFYAMFAFLGHLALIPAGYLGIQSCELQKIFGKLGGDDCEIILEVVTIAFLMGGTALLFLRRWMAKHVLSNPFYYDAAASQAKVQKPKVKLTFMEGIKLVASSPYIGLIVVLILGYGISNNILGLYWKKQLQIAFPAKYDYQRFMGQFSMFTGVSTITLTFLFKGIIPRFGWFAGAMITPAVLFLAGTFFFGFIIFDAALAPLTAFMGLTPLVLAVGIGTFQQVISKSAKYAMFDPTKEMAYIPLDEALKTRGKAAADVIGHSLSKASSGYIITFIMIVSATRDLLELTPILGGVVLVIILGWIFSVRALNHRYQALVNFRKEEKLRDAGIVSSVKSA